MYARPGMPVLGSADAAAATGWLVASMCVALSTMASSDVAHAFRSPTSGAARQPRTNSPLLGVRKNYSMLDTEDIHIRTYLYLSHKRDEGRGDCRSPAAAASPRLCPSWPANRLLSRRHQASRSAPRLAKPKSQVTRNPHAACS
jgi:hypothetical protein